LLFCNQTNAKEEIIIAADQWCPYNCDPKNEKELGFIVDVAKTIFAKHDIAVKYVEMPWSRAKKEVSINNIQGIIGATIEDVNNLKGKLVFPQEEQARLKNTFFTLKSNPWVYKKTSSLTKIKLGIIKDYNYGPEIHSIIENKLHNSTYEMTGSKPLERLITMLKLKRIDAILEDKAVFQYTANKMKFYNFRVAGSDQSISKENDIFIAFSQHKNSKRYAKILTDGMRQIRKSGKLKKILSKYSLKDWK